MKTERTGQLTAPPANWQNGVAETGLSQAEVANATAGYSEPATAFDAPELQPLPDASEAAWDRWVIDVGGADFPTWRAACQRKKFR